MGSNNQKFGVQAQRVNYFLPPLPPIRLVSHPRIEEEAVSARSIGCG